MKQITTITDVPNQNMILVLDDGSKIDFTLNYFSNQNGWFYSLNYNNGQFIVNNRRLVCSPNMLSAFVNIIPFGLAVITIDGYEPIYIDDFVTGRASFYTLNSTDVATVEASIINAQ